ncbi:MAG: excinuclease ABC subunit UvrB [Bacteroidetes bacterium]|nr:excinuclease ABC subunit UvrB [Bacteroidota bacterium]
MPFTLVSPFIPSGDQPEAIKQLTEGLNRGDKYQVLLGVTGSGKTYTIANVIEKVQRPVLVISHNKTLAAQLYGEFKQFFPDNAVEYFVSYYDYYQPEAYIPSTDTYIEKDLAINEEIEKLRLSATSTLLSGRRDVIVVSSVSCIYGIGNPDDFHKGIIPVKKGEITGRNRFLRKLVDSLYNRTTADFKRGNFRVMGDTVDVFLAYTDYAVRLIFFDNVIEEIYSFDPFTGVKIEDLESIYIFPANIFVTDRNSMERALGDIYRDMTAQVQYFKDQGRIAEAQRLESRITYDVEMMRELGYCSGVENYSRYFDGRKPGTRPFCLIDYFPDDFLLIIDESHATVPQVRGMYGGDRSRKATLVEYGFRLPAAMDNRPLKFEEFEGLVNQVIYLSATPADFELQRSGGVIVEQVVRPTGLLDPSIEVRPTLNQIDDLMEEIRMAKIANERVLVTTLTKRMAEELSAYLHNLKINCRYIHSDVETLERVELMRQLRLGDFDVLIGVNLLREGLDLPEVSLVIILDADKEGFLRSERSLTQTAGRAARHVNGRVIMYADKITDSMQKTIDETYRRRLKQINYNMMNSITPAPIRKSITDILGQTSVIDNSTATKRFYSEKEDVSVAADPVIKYMGKDEIAKTIASVRKKMEEAAKELDFVAAAKFRDEMFALQKMLKEEKM